MQELNIKLAYSPLYSILSRLYLLLDRTGQQIEECPSAFISVCTTYRDKRAVTQLKLLPLHRRYRLCAHPKALVAADKIRLHPAAIDKCLGKLRGLDIAVVCVDDGLMLKALNAQDVVKPYPLMICAALDGKCFYRSR